MRALLLAVFATLAAAAPADALVTELRLFRVTMEGTGTYERHDRFPTPNGTETTDVVTEFAWRSVIGRFLVDNDGKPAGPAYSTTEGSSWGSGTEIHVRPRHGEPAERSTCTATQKARPTQGRLELTPATVGGEAGLTMRGRPLGQLFLDAACLPGGRPGLIGIWTGDETLFDHEFFMPALALNQAKVIQHVPQPEATKAPARCPRQVPHETQDCVLRWQGKVTFELLERIPVAPIDDRIPAPPTPPSPPPAPDLAPAPFVPPGPGGVAPPCTTPDCRYRAALAACGRVAKARRTACRAKARRALATAKCRSVRGAKARARCVRRRAR